MKLSRAVAAPLFIVGGGWLILMSMLGGLPSLWYFFCFCALLVIGILWLWKPPLAATLSIGPLVSVAAMLHYIPGIWAFSRIYAGCLVVGLAVAVVLVVSALRGFSGWRLPLLISLAFLATSFATDRLFTNKVIIRTYQMYVAVNGHAPWGDVGRQSSDGSPPIVLYRRVGDTYCYDAFQSEELRQRLAPKEGHTVTVEYNVFSDFGKERSYNVRSVDGLLLNNAKHTVRDLERFGGQILGEEATPAANCR